MRQLKSLIWKEWNETQVFLWIGWGLFIGLPIVGGLEISSGYPHHFEFYAAPWIYSLGPVLAIVIGVAVTCRDLQPKLEDFWQSRPMGGMRLFVVKYFVAAGIVLLACGAPLLIELFLKGRDAASPGVLWTAFLWLSSYSIAFAAGCVLRRTAYAASLAIVGLMLLIFVPVVVPPLRGFEVSQTEDWSFGGSDSAAAHGPKLQFAAGMLAVSIATGALGLVAVRRHWHLQSSRPLIYSTLAAAFFILLISASYQLGTNLPVLQHVGLPERESIQSIQGAGGHYIAYSYIWLPRKAGERDVRKSYSRSVDIRQTNLKVGPRLNDTGFVAWGVYLNPRAPAVGYYVDNPESNGDVVTSLAVATEKEMETGIPLRSIELWRIPTRDFHRAYLYLLNDRLYVAGKKSFVFDISDPRRPVKLSESPTPFAPSWNIPNDPSLTFPLPPAEGLSRAERLKFLTHMHEYLWATSPDGTVWCRASKIAGTTQENLALYHLRTLDDQSATFDRVATYTPTLVQSIMGSGSESFNQMTMRGNLLYVRNDWSHLVVFDLSGPRPLRLVAHFVALDGIGDCMPLADGRSLVGGSDLWLLGPPPTHQE